MHEVKSVKTYSVSQYFACMWEGEPKRWSFRSLPHCSSCGRARLSCLAALGPNQPIRTGCGGEERCLCHLHLCHHSPQREHCLTFVLAEGGVTLVAQGDMGRFSPSLLVLHMLGFAAFGLAENVQLYIARWHSSAPCSAPRRVFWLMLGLQLH